MAMNEKGRRRKGLSEQKEQLAYKMEVRSSLHSVQNQAGDRSSGVSPSSRSTCSYSRCSHKLLRRCHQQSPTKILQVLWTLATLTLQFSKDPALDMAKDNHSSHIHFTPVSGMFTSQLCLTTWNVPVHAHRHTHTPILMSTISFFLVHGSEMGMKGLP